MIAFLVAVLYWALKVAVICLVAWLILWLLNSFIPIPANIKYVIGVVVWAVVAIAAIALLIPIIASADGLAFIQLHQTSLLA